MATYNVIGQSNTILQEGFISKLIGMGGHQLSRSARMGASPSTATPFLVDASFFSGVDFCLVDTCVMDFALCENGSFDLFYVGEYLKYIGHLARMSGCEPVFIIIPSSTHLDRISINPVYNYYMSLLADGGYLYFDVRDLARSVLEKSGGKLDDYYTDPSHPGPQLSSDIANVINIALSTLSLSDEFIFRTDTVPVYKRLLLPDLIPACVERVEHESSLLQFRGVKLKERHRYKIHSGPFEDLSGFLINSAACFRNLKIITDQEYVVTASVKMSQGYKFFSRVINISRKIANTSQSFEIEVVGRDETPNELKWGCQKELDSDNNFIEISEILVRTGRQNVGYLTKRFAPHESNLFRLCSQAPAAESLPGGDLNRSCEIKQQE